MRFRYFSWLAFAIFASPVFGQAGTGESIDFSKFAETDIAIIFTTRNSDANKFVTDRIPQLVDNKLRSTSRSTINGQTTMRITPVNDPVKFLAKLTQYGRVSKIDGNRVYFAVKKLDLPKVGTDPISKLLFDLESPNGLTQRKAMEQLGKFPPVKDKTEAVSKAVTKILEESDDSTAKEGAAKLIGAWQLKEQVPLLYKLAAQDKLKYTEARRAAIETLARFPDAKSAEVIAQQLSNFFAREAASKALQTMGKVGEKSVIAMATHKDSQTRVEVCKILSIIGAAESLPVLEKLKNDRTLSVRDEAATAYQIVQVRAKN